MLRIERLRAWAVETFRSQDAVSAKEAATVVIPRRFE